MSTVVTVLDRPGWDGDTDNIVVIDTDRRQLRWVPRDLWCRGLGDRVNTAFKRGGHDRLLSALAELRFSVEHSICLRRDVIEAALADVAVTVPVAHPLRFWCPLEPGRELDRYMASPLRPDADHSRWRLVEFNPPSETVAGLRLHDWLGARFELAGGSGDLARIERQQIFLVSLLRSGFDFSRVLVHDELVSISDPAALADCSSVAPGWPLTTYRSVKGRRIDGKLVLVPRRRLSVLGGLARLRGTAPPDRRVPALAQQRRARPEPGAEHAAENQR